MDQERLVLDSYAMLAFLENEHGAQEIARLLQNASTGHCRLFVSLVNVGEVLYITERRKGWPKARETLARMDELPIEIVDPNRAQTLAAAHIKARWPLAYADCFAAALAKLNGAAVVTGDPEFRQLEAAAVVQVSWLPTT